LVLAAFAAVAFTACKPRGAGQNLPQPASGPALAARPEPAQAAAESLAQALASPPGPNGMRLAVYCPAPGSGDECFANQVAVALLGDIGRRTRQGAGVLIVEAAPETGAFNAAAGCAGQAGLLSFKLVPMSVFPKGAIAPIVKSPCYTLGSQAKLSDCQCLGNIRKALDGLAAEAKTRGAVLAVLDARRFGSWETAPVKKDEATVGAPGFDLVYALVPKPKNFDAAPPIDFVAAEAGQAMIQGASAVEAPPLRIELPDTDAPAAKAAGADIKKSDEKSGAPKSGSASESKDTSKKKHKDKDGNKDRKKDKDKTKDKEKHTDKDRSKDRDKGQTGGQPSGAAAQ
ncbi:MAG: hypothetical protein HQK81_14395, partial [Desulfovibrionaceae bacterium]|nr:hypothetical protein [Desulfovibrionaceae bacterium]